ncbi:Short-chain alcohol dehydrogenase [Microbacterium sp. C448]|uniref:SDR family NAD(P)-dependent oxidoreductase n=1 Tax=Microbacterium sp. C448 TaxID=1177594 RepID=UPI0003DE6270|nr:SDR family NAD(P)-dependent oxidoreductase [Microbacterium sp. C448]CDJ99502.1 Short-chain alcohol dehydrogenase [Microbacterium sp. C448]
MLDVRVALITGCGKSDGVGQAIARRLSDDGFAVVVTDREPGGVRNQGDADAAPGSGIDVFVASLEAEGRTAVALVGDIGDPADVTRMLETVDERFGRLDVLVNNAAAPQGPDRADIGELSLEAWNELIRVNLTGTFLMCQAGVALMRRGRYGRIINISSMAAITAAPRSVPYSAAKAGILGLTRALSMDVARWGITVNAIAPGLVGTSRSMLGRRDTDREEHLRASARKVAVGKVGMPVDIANAVAFFADERTSHVTAQTMQIDGGGNSSFPLSGPDDGDDAGEGR